MHLYIVIFLLCSNLLTTSNAPQLNVSTIINSSNNKTTVNNDDLDLKQILLSAKDGSIIHLKPGVYMIDSLIRIPSKSLTIYAYGATIQMKPQAGYNALIFQQDVDPGSYKGKFEWYGGIFDGNREYQNSPVAHLDNQNKLAANAKLEWHGKGNTGLLTVGRYQTVTIKDVTVQNNSGEGIVVMNCKDVLYKDCVGKNGVEISENNVFNKMNTGGEGHQWTYFKVRSEFDCHATWDSVYTNGGSIGIHYSSNNAGLNSLAIIKNCVIENPAQDAVHIEHCESVIMDNLKVSGALVDNKLNYRPSIHVGNQCKEAYLHKIYIQNGFIDFRQGSRLKKCIVDDFTIVSDLPRDKPMFTKALTLQNGTIKGNFRIAIANSDSVKNVNIISTVQGQGVGIVNAGYVSNCTFSNLKQAGNLKQNAQVINSKINNCETGWGENNTPGNKKNNKKKPNAF